MLRTQASDNDDDDDALSLSASELCDRAMSVYNEPISNLAQRDVHGNDLRLPKLERKLRKYVEFFAEEVMRHSGTPLSRRTSVIAREHRALAPGGHCDGDGPARLARPRRHSREVRHRLP